MTILQPLFKNLKRYRKEQGHVVLYILQNHVDDASPPIALHERNRRTRHEESARKGPVIDAYAGTGDTATMLATSGARVTAIELDREAAAVCAKRLPAGSRVLFGRVESLLMSALPADVVVVNPPRAGLHERVTTALERQSRRPRAIVYVSCDPATLARDLTRLPSYRIASIETFDMFPQTAHVETVCELVPTAT